MELDMRPGNGWRGFAGEVGVIVLGVAIALAGQEAVETLNERAEAEETRGTVTDEIRETLAILELRRAAQPCIDKRLTELRAIIDQWGRTGTFKTPRWVSQATWFALFTARFDAADSAGRLALLSNEEQFRLGLTVGRLRNFQQVQLAEMEAWATLRMLQSGADALSPSDRTAVRAALQQASLLNYRAKVLVGQTLQQAAEYGLRSDMSRVRRLVAQAWRGGKITPSVCLPIDTPPDQANREANQLYRVPE